MKSSCCEELLLGRSWCAALEACSCRRLQQLRVLLQLREAPRNLAYCLAKLGGATLKSRDNDGTHVSDGAAIKAAFPAKPDVVEDEFRHVVSPVVFPMHPSPGASVKNSVLLSAPCSAPRFPHLAGVTHFVFGVIRRLACMVWRPPIWGVRQVPEPAWGSKFVFRAMPVSGDRSAKIPDC